MRYVIREMNHRPYIWMGEAQDAHVLDFERLEREFIRRDYANASNAYAAHAGLLNVQPLQWNPAALQNLTPTAAYITQREQEERLTRLVAYSKRSQGVYSPKKIKKREYETRRENDDARPRQHFDHDLIGRYTYENACHSLGPSWWRRRL